MAHVRSTRALVQRLAEPTPARDGAAGHCRAVRRGARLRHDLRGQLAAAQVADLGQARVVRSEAQVASVASMLAAGNALHLDGTPRPDFTVAIAAAKHYAAKNHGTTEPEWATCQDPVRCPTDPRARPASPSTTAPGPPRSGWSRSAR